MKNNVWSLEEGLSLLKKIIIHGLELSNLKARDISQTLTTSFSNQ